MQEKLNNNKVIREARREMGKFHLDYSKITLSFRRGTLSIFGKIIPLKGYEHLFSDQHKALFKALVNLPEIHQVVVQ